MIFLFFMIIVFLNSLTSIESYVVKMINLQKKPISVWLNALEKKRDNIFVFLTEQYYYEFNEDLRAIAAETLNVTVSQKMPYVNLFDKLEGHNHTVCGYIGDLWSELEDLLHFKTRFRIKHEIINERAALRDSKDNLLLNPILVNSEDQNEFDRTMPIATTWFQLSVANPTGGSSFFYMSIFTPALLAAFLSTMIILSVALWLVVHITSKKEITTQQDVILVNHSNIIDGSFMESFLTILGAIINQGMQVKPLNGSLRLITIISTFFGYVLIQSYSAILISQLAIVQPPSEIHLDSIPDLKPRLSLCVSPSNIAYQHFQIHGSNMIQQRWKPFLNKPPCTVETNDIVPLQDYCNKRNVVFESAHNTNFIHNEAQLKGNHSALCNFHSFRERYYYSYISLLTKKNFRYTKLISNFLLKFHTMGIIKKLQETWLPQYPSSQSMKIKSHQAILFWHMKDLLFLYLIGLFISLVVFTMEIIIKRKSSSVIVNETSFNIMKKNFK